MGLHSNPANPRQCKHFRCSCQERPEGDNALPNNHSIDRHRIQRGHKLSKD